MSSLVIRAVESEVSFSVFLNGSDKAAEVLFHNEDFPAFDGGDYEEESEIDVPEWDEIELVWTGCPEGYVIVVFKRRGLPVLCLLYGPEGYMGSFGDPALAANAAKEDHKRRQSRGFGM